MIKLFLFILGALLLAVLCGCRIMYKSEVVGGFPKREFIIEHCEKEAPR